MGQRAIKLLAVTPGGSDASFWDEWLRDGHLSVGYSGHGREDWDHVPDLRSYENREEFY